ncbi:TPA: threonine--tRNA ligase [bacterium]|nr:threonine--tRNA ligase [bacterium]
MEEFWHSTSHIMASAVCRIFGDIKLGIGPAIAEGFYYDFDCKIQDEDLPKIEDEMRKIIDEDQRFEKIVMNIDEARKFLERQTYKLEILDEIDDEHVSFYKNGSFTDLCKGPHIERTGQVKAFKLLKIAGAYWRGDEKNPMLTRIYGISFESKEELDDYLKKQEEAKKRDHRILGPQLGLFEIYDEVGGGLAFWHPKGNILRDEIIWFLKKEHKNRGYFELTTPHIGKIELWEQSGHCDYYRENIYFIEKEEENYVLKPMNCPGHIMIYKSKMRSYKDLPIRYFELGTVYRYERSGVLHGLLRVRGFTQDDAHIFCNESQLKNEIEEVCRFAFDMLSRFGFNEYEIYLSTKPEKYVGEDEIWDLATDALKGVLEEQGLNFSIDPGAGVFYGPKIDIKLLDALNRAWQGPTIQVDFNLPDRFDLSYIGDDGRKYRPVMIHRVVLGSLERFIGCLVEHYAGKFPLWLSPTQVIILPITDNQLNYAKNVERIFISEGIRTELDSRSEKLQRKIKDAQELKIPYMIIIGKKEEEQEKISIRHRSKGDIGPYGIDDFIKNLKDEIREKLSI